jgi:hypothetical protein
MNLARRYHKARSGSCPDCGSPTLRAPALRFLEKANHEEVVWRCTVCAFWIYNAERLFN